MNNKMKEKLSNLNIALPHDLVLDILLRLPLRSLLRFKCVSTSWLSLISHPQFAKSHFDLASSSPTHRLLLRTVNDDSELESFDLQASLVDNSAVVNLKSPTLYFQNLGSCRGLLLLNKKRGPSSLRGRRGRLIKRNSSIDDLIVWNPSTGSHREIPPFELLQGDLYGFGYDTSNDDYLLVVIRLGEFQPQLPQRIGVLSLKTNETSSYGDEVVYMVLGPWAASGLYFNRSLHWPVTDMDYHNVVIAFDLVERSLSEISLSPDLSAILKKYDGYHLGVLGGCLSLSYSGGALSVPEEGDDLDKTEIWVMKEYKVQASWTKSFVISVHSVTFLPICLTEGGEVIGSDGTGGLQKFNDKGELLENHKFGIEDQHFLKYFDMYRESLLSLPGEGDIEEENGDA